MRAQQSTADGQSFVVAYSGAPDRRGYRDFTSFYYPIQSATEVCNLANILNQRSAK